MTTATIGSKFTYIAPPRATSGSAQAAEAANASDGAAPTAVEAAAVGKTVTSAATAAGVTPVTTGLVARLVVIQEEAQIRAAVSSRDAGRAYTAAPPS